jgi:hypothetical protein
VGLTSLWPEKPAGKSKGEGEPFQLSDECIVSHTKGTIPQPNVLVTPGILPYEGRGSYPANMKLWIELHQIFHAETRRRGK